MDKSKTNIYHFFELNLAVLFISTSGVLGRYIELPVPLTIFLRALLAVVFLALYSYFKKDSLKLASKDRKIIAVSGVFMGLHWITYFYALQVSNVAIAIISLYTFPVITAILEPVLLKTSFHKSHILTGVIVILGIYILSPEINFNSNYFKGVASGVLSALFYALRNIIIKPKVSSYSQSSILLYQMLVISFMLAPALYYFKSDSVIEFIPALLILALVTTVLGHSLFIKSLKHFSASSASLISSMQPLYGIVLAFLILNEEPGLNTLFGGSLVVLAVVLETLRSKT